MQPEQRWLRHPLFRELQIPGAREAQERLVISEVHRHPPLWCVCSFDTVALADTRLRFVENGEWMVIDYVKESVLNLCKAEAIDQFCNRIRFLVGHLLKHMKDQTDCVGAAPVIDLAYGFDRALKRLVQRSFVFIIGNSTSAIVQ